MFICLLHISINPAVCAKPKVSKETVKDSIEKQLQILNAPKPASDSKKNSVTEPPVPSQPSSGVPVSTELKKIDAKFSMVREGEVVKVTLNFDKGVPYYAVFCRGNDWYITLSYPTNSTMIDWHATEFPEITSIDTLSNNDAFSYLIHFNKKVYPKITFDDQKNSLTVNFGQERIEEGQPVSITQPRKKEDAFRLQLRNARTDVEFEPDKLDQILWVICCEDRNKPIAAHHYPEFDILESYQGVAFLLRADDLDYSYVRKVAEISKEGGMGNSYTPVPQSADLISSIFSDFNPLTAPQISKDVLRTLVRGDPHIKDGLYLIWLYLGQGLGQEAADMAEQVLGQAPDLNLLPFWRSLRGLASLLRFRYQKVPNYLNFITNEPEVECWSTIAQAVQDVYSKPTNMSKLLQYKNILMASPVALQERLRNDILEVGIISHNKSILMIYANNFAAPTFSQNKPLFEVATAVLNLDPTRPSSAAALQTMSEKDPTSKASILAAFEYLKFLHETKKIDPTDELKQLDHLRYSWRGDLLEYTICKYLAQRYMEEHRYAEALPLLRKTIKYFTKESHTDKLPEQMQQALIDYFNQKSPPVLEMLSIFQDYTSIAPDDERGDAIMIKATNILANLELYEEAVGLLKDYLENKVKEGSNLQNRKNLIYYRMAVASILGNKPKDCLDYLSDIHDIAGQMLDDIAILKSESYLRLKKTEQALQSLGDTPAQQFHKASIYFGDKRWVEAAGVYQGIAQRASGVLDQIKENSIVNLALCYAILNDQKALADVQANFKEFMAKRKGEQTFNFLTTPDAKVSLAHLASLQQVDSFADRLKAVFSDTTKPAK
ncbi:tetratricopeptide repeat protein [Candidatus Odyssella acanthamoebae]|uniref:Tetratricopeptide repeat protein n=1 Tax=Candidatus Odyssella acanthamoebae TaxID=91604 RepID=A0A077AVS6_9PROT|nr:hypothetical protein [Candidatus Paracaedibacter acanthamoebae]AIK97252.1 hypothetical protein ID47_11700 [Candidatus Paracaedibacter acanthamoebae]